MNMRLVTVVTVVAAVTTALTGCRPDGVPPIPGALPTATPSAGTSATGPAPTPSAVAAPSTTPTRGAEPSATSAPTQPPRSDPRRNLLLEANFDTCDLGQFDGREALDSEITLVTSGTRAGRCAARVEVRQDQFDQGGGKWRAEVKNEGAGSGNHGAEGRERWFGFSTRTPGNQRPMVGILFQLHERPDSCEDWRSPAVALSTDGERMNWNVRWDPKACSDGNNQQGRNIASIPNRKDRWMDWVVHVVWSHTGEGLVEVWADGKKITTYRGPVGYNDRQEAYGKWGVYHYDPTPESWPSAKRVVSFLDEVRMGGAAARYEDVAP